MVKIPESKYICNEMSWLGIGIIHTHRKYIQGTEIAKQEMKKRLEDSLESFTFGFDASVGYSNLSSTSAMDRTLARQTYVCVLAKSEADPVVPLADTPFFYCLNVSLFLEHLGVLRHVFGTGKAVEITNIGLAIKYGDEWSFKLSKTGEWQGRKEGQGLDLLERSNTVLGMRDKGSNSTPGDVSEIENEVLGAVIDRSAKNSSPVLQVCPCFLRG